MQKLQERLSSQAIIRNIGKVKCLTVSSLLFHVNQTFLKNINCHSSVCCKQIGKSGSLQNSPI